MKARVLVTGATGFIGRATIARLARSDVELHATFRSQPLESERNVRWHRATDTVIEEIAPTHLIDLAWYMGRRDHLTTELNLPLAGAALERLERFAASGGKRAIFAGTYAEYGVREGVCREDDPAEPVTLYAVCKDALRRIALAFAKSRGIEAVWTRIFTVYGPHDAPYRVIPYAIETLLSGGMVEATEGKQVRDFIHVADVAAAFDALLLSPLTGIVNVGSGEGRSVAQALRAIAAALNGQDRLNLGAKQQAPGETQSIVADVARLRSTGWKPQFTFESGIAETIEFCRQERARA